MHSKTELKSYLGTTKVRTLVDEVLKNIVNDPHRNGKIRKRVVHPIIEAAKILKKYGFNDHPINNITAKIRAALISSGINLSDGSYSQKILVRAIVHRIIYDKIPNDRKIIVQVAIYEAIRKGKEVDKQRKIVFAKRLSLHLIDELFPESSPENTREKNNLGNWYHSIKLVAERFGLRTADVNETHPAIGFSTSIKGVLKDIFKTLPKDKMIYPPILAAQILVSRTTDRDTFHRFSRKIRQIANEQGFQVAPSSTSYFISTQKLIHELFGTGPKERILKTTNFDSEILDLIRKAPEKIIDAKNKTIQISLFYKYYEKELGKKLNKNIKRRIRNSLMSKGYNLDRKLREPGTDRSKAIQDYLDNWKKEHEILPINIPNATYSILSKLFNRKPTEREIKEWRKAVWAHVKRRQISTILHRRRKDVFKEQPKIVRIYNAEGQSRQDLSDPSTLSPDQVIMKEEDDRILEDRAQKVDDKLLLLMKEDQIGFQVLSFKFGLNGTPVNLSDIEISNIIGIKPEHIPVILEKTLAKLKNGLAL